MREAAAPASARRHARRGDVVAPGQRLYWFSVPIRHWKSTTLRQAAVRHLCRWPDRGVAFCSHTQTFASKESRQLRKLARQARLAISDEAGRQDEWAISGKDGGLVARGVGGELTGRGFRLIVVDDRRRA